MADINLLPSEEQASSQLVSLQKKLAVFSVFVLVVAAAFSVATLVMFTAAKEKENRLNERIGGAAAQVNSHQLAEELLTVVDKKTDSASKAIASRLLYTEVLKKTAELMPTGIAFANLSIDGVEMKASATANTSADVAKLVSYFVTTEEGKKLFASLNIDSLATDVDGKYAFSVSMKMNQAAVQVPLEGI
ncbi:MAG: hypothetical protein UU23_C0001G0065 [Candidatus Curtissbacteria bacterium GW2011_GWA1_40_9]|uniref:Fimbrial assembly family protein n=1 Tax=Candidatus Curtissbacteria bacterium GW2011_GWA1_40_9 TaxID=1618408 RepID=A0A0G0TU01_9BACT|nr:MAG: hypothetical protein UU23_C0001G0065 [Candidatus Curtissbacteria bacterium GW2011_GWA1_40_9]